jgi:ubiquinone/menaquinone biosynthesis C-methylase UbiE
MLRVLEPELMDTAEDAAEYDSMDFLEPNRRFAEDALELVRHLPRVRAIDLGTGTARIPILMAERRREISIVAADLAEQMLRVASRNVEAAGLSDRIELARLDAKGAGLPSAAFDLVMSNSTLHHIPDPAELLREIARLVKPGGAVIVRDLIRPESTDDARAIVERVAAEDSPKQKQLFFDSLCAALTVDEVAALVEAAGLERMRVERCSDRHWTAERAAVQ